MISWHFGVMVISYTQMDVHTNMHVSHILFYVVFFKDACLFIFLVFQSYLSALCLMFTQSVAFPVCTSTVMGMESAVSNLGHVFSLLDLQYCG